MNKHTLIEQCETMIARIDDLEKLGDPLAPGFIKNREIARIALASLTAAPVAYRHHSGQVITREECCDDEVFAICCKVERPLYTTTPVASPVPDGWKLVPITATRSMIQAGATAARQYMEETGGNSPYVIYQAMVASAPSPSAEGNHEQAR